MPHRAKRITLVVTNPNLPDLDWKHQRGQRLIFTESIEIVEFMLEGGMHAIDLDIERCVIDRAVTDRQFLELQTMLPEGFAGDVLSIVEDGSAFLSATGRGGGRVLYTLTAADVRFYLEAHDIVTGRLALGEQQKIA